MAAAAKKLMKLTFGSPAIRAIRFTVGQGTSIERDGSPAALDPDSRPAHGATGGQGGDGELRQEPRDPGAAREAPLQEDRTQPWYGPVDLGYSMP